MTNQDTAQLVRMEVRQKNENKRLLQEKLDQAQHNLTVGQDNTSKTKEFLDSESFAEAAALASQNLDIINRARLAITEIEQSEKLSNEAREIEREAMRLAIEVETTLITVEQQEIQARIYRDALRDYGDELNTAIEYRHWSLAYAYCQHASQLAPNNSWFQQKNQEISEYSSKQKGHISPNFRSGLLLVFLISLISVALFYVFWQQLEPSFVPPYRHTLTTTTALASFPLSFSDNSFSAGQTS
ncbi:MAG: hypothetical protein IPM39_19500 [Chloroflexi bacterium]|nr:hypothetical protein [Chloroflexota bacterium]